VQRLADVGDNRHTVVEMTEAGERLTADRKVEVLTRLTGILELLGPDDAAEYIRLQKKITEAAEGLLL
jgi:DNA-binding MarR family transcriptional regulator